MRKLTLAIAVIAPMLGHAASAEDTIKIGYIDPLSGGGASVGEGGLKTFQYLADELNAKGGILGHKIEILPLDNKTNPQESLVQAQKAIDAGVHYITQGNGSSVAAALCSSTGPARQVEIQQRRISMAEMEVAVRAWRKSENGWRHDLSTLSLPDLIRQSIVSRVCYDMRWMRGSSPRMTSQ